MRVASVPRSAEVKPLFWRFVLISPFFCLPMGVSYDGRSWVSSSCRGESSQVSSRSESSQVSRRVVSSSLGF